MLWKAVEAVTTDGIRDFNAQLPTFFRESAVKYLAGPPYEDQVHIDG